MDGRARRRVAILQSCYIPWKGYFDIIGSVDAFVVYDDVQYRKNHWHNRNLIKTQAGLSWLTIPVTTGASSFNKIENVTVAQPFARRHWRSLEQNYSAAPYFETYRSWLLSLYAEAESQTHLGSINLLFLRAICDKLGITTPFFFSSQLSLEGSRTERLVNICQALGATSYLSGPSARNYLDTRLFHNAGIDVEWMDYTGYPEYAQQHGKFEHAVSMLDVVLNTGDKASAFMKWTTHNPSSEIDPQRIRVN